MSYAKKRITACGAQPLSHAPDLLRTIPLRMGIQDIYEASHEARGLLNIKINPVKNLGCIQASEISLLPSEQVLEA